MKPVAFLLLLIWLYEVISGIIDTIFCVAAFTCLLCLAFTCLLCLASMVIELKYQFSNVMQICHKCDISSR